MKFDRHAGACYAIARIALSAAPMEVTSAVGYNEAGSRTPDSSLPAGSLPSTCRFQEDFVQALGTLLNITAISCMGVRRR